MKFFRNIDEAPLGVSLLIVHVNGRGERVIATAKRKSWGEHLFEWVIFARIDDCEETNCAVEPECWAPMPQIEV